MASIQNLYETVVGVLGDQASKVISALGEITVECLPKTLYFSHDRIARP